ncbi:MAG: 4Fe-4S dicluster domain-containing protein [Clostridia bacterium]|nr:4Fe-4S dicluster domain-containing protein [Clostridia bacterium]
MIRRIICIDEEKCNGCGACASACHEGAIDMVNGKARLMRENYCDGLGDCLPACPTGAISFEEREAPAYDEEAVKRAQLAAGKAPCAGGCPGTSAQMMDRRQSAAPASPICSQLRQWPVQIKLSPPNAPYFDGAHLLIAADCTAYAYGNFHQDFIRDRVVLIGCPKLDAVDYSDKLMAIIAGNRISSVTVVRMDVPCCSGIEHAVRRAIGYSGKALPLQVITVTTDGRIRT